nr:secreted frizzled-related protein 3 isoform X2 [Aotus nancymaae]
MRGMRWHLKTQRCQQLQSPSGCHSSHPGSAEVWAPKKCCGFCSLASQPGGNGAQLLRFFITTSRQTECVTGSPCCPQLGEQGCVLPRGFSTPYLGEQECTLQLFSHLPFDFPMDSSNGNCRGASSERCKCKPIRATQKTYFRNNYNYVIRAKVKEIKTKCHDVTAVVEVKEILKSSLVNIPRDTVNLYTSSGCLCPPLNVNEEYVIMGYEDEERSRLLLVEGSIAEKWKDRLGKKVKRWDMKLRHLELSKSDSSNSDSTQSQKSGRNSNPRQARN